MRLATFLHISDLHFGHETNLSGDASAPDYLAFHWLFDGYLGHDYHALKKIEELFSYLRDRENAELIVTGDLTSVGHENEFQMARDYFEGTLELSADRRLGLHSKKWRDRAVPGNHDHWPGNMGVFGGPTRSMAKVFPESQRPLLSSKKKLSSGHHLRFIGLDSDADVNPYGLHRLFAIGSFCSQLSRVEERLPPPDENEIRVLLLHHPLARKHLISGIAAKSKRYVKQFIHRNNIAVVLSGHTHVPHVCVLVVSQNYQKHEFLEATCGTSCQRSSPPYNWPISRELHRKVCNTVLIHRLYEEDGEVFWSAKTHWYSPSCGFEDEMPKGLYKGQKTAGLLKIAPRSM